MQPDLDQAIRRIPSVIVALGIIGAAAAAHFGGLPYAIAFLIGAAAAYFNFRLIQRFVTRLVAALVADPANPPKASGLVLFIQLALFLAGAFVILRFTGINIVVAVYGFLVCPAAVMLEAIYYLILNYGHS